MEYKFLYFCAPFLGDVAQLVEQRTENPCVGGSIPSITTSLLRGFFLSFSMVNFDNLVKSIVSLNVNFCLKFD